MSDDATHRDHGGRPLAEQLSRLRQRGLAELEFVQGGKERFIGAPDLERLAAEYCQKRRLKVYGRSAQLRRLLIDGVAAFAERGNADDAALIRDLFLGEDDNAPIGKTDALLKEAKRKHPGEDFDTRRRAVFATFGDFLDVFVNEVPPVNEVPRQPRLRYPVALTVGLVLILLVGAGAYAAFENDEHPEPQPTTSSGPTGVPSPDPSSSQDIPDGLYEVQQGSNGASVFGNPRTVSNPGTKIPPWKKVLVSCKLYAVSMDSVDPDGYWYKIESAPWSGQFWAAANTFMNGDKPGENNHKTDWRIPDCPE